MIRVLVIKKWGSANDTHSRSNYWSCNIIQAPSSSSSVSAKYESANNPKTMQTTIEYDNSYNTKSKPRWHGRHDRLLWGWNSPRIQLRLCEVAMHRLCQSMCGEGNDSLCFLWSSVRGSLWDRYEIEGRYFDRWCDQVPIRSRSGWVEVAPRAELDKLGRFLIPQQIHNHKSMNYTG